MLQPALFINFPQTPFLHTRSAHLPHDVRSRWSSSYRLVAGNPCLLTTWGRFTWAQYSYQRTRTYAKRPLDATSLAAASNVAEGTSLTKASTDLTGAVESTGNHDKQEISWAQRAQRNVEAQGVTKAVQALHANDGPSMYMPKAQQAQHTGRGASMALITACDTAEALEEILTRGALLMDPPLLTACFSTLAKLTQARPARSETEERLLGRLCELASQHVHHMSLTQLLEVLAALRRMQMTPSPLLQTSVAQRIVSGGLLKAAGPYVLTAVAGAIADLQPDIMRPAAASIAAALPPVSQLSRGQVDALDLMFRRLQYPHTPLQQSSDKYLTASITSCRSAGALCDLILSKGDHFNQIHVAAGFKKLSTLQGGSREVEQAAEELAQLAVQHLPNMGLRELSGILNACGKLHYVPSNALLNMVVQHLTAHSSTWLPEATPQALAMAAWGIAVLELDNAPPVMKQLATAAEPLLAEFKPFELGTLAWALAHAQYYQPRFAQQLAERALACMDQLDERTRRTLPWALGTMGHYSVQLLAEQDPTLIMHFIRRCNRLQDMQRMVGQIGPILNARHITACFSQMTRFMPERTPEGISEEALASIDVLCEAAMAHVASMGAREVATVLHCLGTWRYTPRGGLLDVLAAHLVDRGGALLRDATPQALGNSAWALGMLQYPAAQPAITALLLAASPKLGEFMPRDLTALAIGLAKLQVQDASFLAALLSESMTRLPAMGPKSISSLMWSLATLGAGERRFMQDLEQAVTPMLARLNGDALTSTVWTIAKVQHRSHRLAAALADAAVPRLAELTVEEYTKVLWCAARLWVQGPSRASNSSLLLFVDEWSRLLPSHGHRFQLVDHCSCVWALGVLARFTNLETVEELLHNLAVLVADPVQVQRLNLKQLGACMHGLVLLDARTHQALTTSLAHRVAALLPEASLRLLCHLTWCAASLDIREPPLPIQLITALAGRVHVGSVANRPLRSLLPDGPDTQAPASKPPQTLPPRRPVSARGSPDGGVGRTAHHTRQQRDHSQPSPLGVTAAKRAAPGTAQPVHPLGLERPTPEAWQREHPFTSVDSQGELEAWLNDDAAAWARSKLDLTDAVFYEADTQREREKDAATVEMEAEFEQDDSTGGAGQGAVQVWQAWCWMRHTGQLPASLSFEPSIVQLMSRCQQQNRQAAAMLSHKEKTTRFGFVVAPMVQRIFSQRQLVLRYLDPHLGCIIPIAVLSADGVDPGIAFFLDTVVCEGELRVRKLRWREPLRWRLLRARGWLIVRVCLSDWEQLSGRPAKLKYLSERWKAASATDQANRPRHDRTPRSNPGSSRGRISLRGSPKGKQPQEQPLGRPRTGELASQIRSIPSRRRLKQEPAEGNLTGGHVQMTAAQQTGDQAQPTSTAGKRPRRMMQEQPQERR